MHPDLQALLALQDKDKAVLAILDELKALEPTMAALDAELEQLEAALAAAQTRAQDADQRREELEGKIEGYRVMQERRRQRLEWVKGAKEASTLMAELDLARTVMAKEEAEWIRSADRVQEAYHLAAESEKAVQELRAAQAPQREELVAKRGELEELLAAAQDERRATAQGVPQEMRERYERILTGRSPLALYPLQNGACGRCFTAVPLHRRQKIQNGDGVDSCEACGVLLYTGTG